MEGTLQGALLAALLFGGYQASGLCLARLALPGEGPGVRLLVGSVWGSVLLQWLPALLAFAVGFTPLAQWLGLGIALALAAGALAGCRRLSRPAFGVREALSAWARRKFLWVVLGVWAFFCFLVWHSFRWEGGAVYSSQATYGDMSMHLSFLTSLANQGDFPPDYSLLPGTRLSYPFLSDSISASLYQLGAPLWFAYQLPMWAAGAQVLFGLYAFFSAMTESRAQAALAWVFFAFNGGFGFFYFLGGGVENFTRIFTAFYETPTNLVGENIRWVNVLVDMMLPQRATLFGWAVLFPALYLLCRAVYQGQRRCFFLVGLMAGALPMIHTHSFLALGLVCGVWLAAWLLGRLCWEVPAARAGKLLLAVGLGALALCKELFRDREDSPLFLVAAGVVLGLFLLWLGLLVGEAFRRRQAREALLPWGVLLGVSLALALPQLCVWTFQQAGEGGFLQGHLGWAIGEESYLFFYLQNLGLAGLLALGGLFLSRGGGVPAAGPGPGHLAAGGAGGVPAQRLRQQQAAVPGLRLPLLRRRPVRLPGAGAAAQPPGPGRGCRGGGGGGLLLRGADYGPGGRGPLRALRHRGRGAGPVGGGQHRPRVGHPHRHPPQQRNRLLSRAQCGVRLPVLPLLPRPVL